jgi:hypothetical protein
MPLKTTSEVAEKIVNKLFPDGISSGQEYDDGSWSHMILGQLRSEISEALAAERTRSGEELAAQGERVMKELEICPCEDGKLNGWHGVSCPFSPNSYDHELTQRGRAVRKALTPSP